MRLFYLEYYQDEKLQTLSREIGWSHNVVIFQKSKDSLEREFYIKMVIKFGWTYRVLDTIKELGGMMPKELPTPKESTSKIEQSLKKTEDTKHKE